MKEITTFELKEKMDKQLPFQLIDTREPEKFEEGHINLAINIPQIDLPENIHILDKSESNPIIIYCHYGVKSQAPYLYLTEKHKFKNVFILEGGLFQWVTDIDPTIIIS